MSKVIIATTPDDSEKLYFPQRKVNGGSAHVWDNYLKKDILSNLFSGKQRTKTTTLTDAIALFLRGSRIFVLIQKN